MAVITDRRIQACGMGEVMYYEAQVVSVTDYYPFGMQIKNRVWNADVGYRFGFNGMEKDDEVKGSGNSLDFGARIYDNRLGRWLTRDPHFSRYPGNSAYCFALNSPIIVIDYDGRDIVPTNNVTNGLGEVWIGIRGNSIAQRYLTTYNGVLDYTKMSKTTNGTTRAILFDPPSVLVRINNKYYNSGSDQTVVLGTLVHELIHAKLLTMIMEMMTYDPMTGQYTINEASMNLYPGVYDYYRKYGDDDEKSEPIYGSTQDWSHNLIADYGRTDIISAMKEQDGLMDDDKSNEVDRSGNGCTSEQWYEAQSWLGLEGTTAWNNLSDEQRSLYTNINMKQQQVNRSAKPNSDSSATVAAGSSGTSLSDSTRKD